MKPNHARTRPLRPGVTSRSLRGLPERDRTGALVAGVMEGIFGDGGGQGTQKPGSGRVCRDPRPGGPGTSRRQPLTELSSRGGHRRSPVPPDTGVAADPHDLPNVTSWAVEALSRDSFDAGGPRADNRAERPSGEAPEFVREGWFGARPRAGDRGGAGGEAQYPPPGVLGQSGQFGVATRRVRCCGADGCSGAGVGAPTGCPPGRRHRTGRDRGPRCDGEPCRRRTLTAYPAASASASRGSDTSTPCHPPSGPACTRRSTGSCPAAGRDRVPLHAGPSRSAHARVPGPGPRPSRPRRGAARCGPRRPLRLRTARHGAGRLRPGRGLVPAAPGGAGGRERGCRAARHPWEALAEDYEL